MVDWSELKRLAEAAYESDNHQDTKAAYIKFYEKAGPEVVLAMITELDQLNERCQRLAARCNSLQAALNEALESR